VTLDVAVPPEARETIFGEKVTESADVEVVLNPVTTTIAVRFTFPLNPPWLLIVRVPVEELPRGTVGKDGPNKSEKSGVVTITKMDVRRVRLPLVP
jgi:hypothetical protein